MKLLLVHNMEIYNQPIIDPEVLISAESYINAIDRCIDYSLYLSKYLYPHNQTLLIYFGKMLIITEISLADFLYLIAYWLTYFVF